MVVLSIHLDQFRLEVVADLAEGQEVAAAASQTQGRRRP
jgi:hypothetical protein